MNFVNSDPNLVLVAPRPVRFHSTSVRFRPPTVSPLALDHIKTNADSENMEPIDLSAELSDKEIRPSNRMTPPAEALEEFLSILKPSLLRSTSPLMRTHRNTGSITMPSFTSYAFAPRFEVITSPKFSSVEEIDFQRMSSPRLAADQSPEQLRSDIDFPWAISSSVISIPASPVARQGARNPFYRNMAIPDHVQTNEAPTVAPHAQTASPLGPAVIPLPPPTPSEFREL